MVKSRKCLSVVYQNSKHYQNIAKNVVITQYMFSLFCHKKKKKSNDFNFGLNVILIDL